MNLKLLIISLGLSLLLGPLGPISPARAQGQTFYVDPAGSDTTGDGSSANPWRTIQHAAAQVNAGDTVVINLGIYAGGIVVDTPGTVAAPVTFRAGGPGVIIDGSGGERDAFFITAADHVVVDGLTIRHATRAGLRISLSDHGTTPITPAAPQFTRSMAAVVHRTTGC